MRITPNKPLIDFNEKLEFIKEYDYDHLIDRLYIHWDLLTKCNFDCSYCHAKRQYQKLNQWNDIDIFERQLLIIKALSISTLPVFLGLQGGEPTIHPRFFEIYNLIQDQILTKNENNRLYITTNGSTNVFKDLNFNKKVFILWSCHFEFKHKYGNNFEKFIDNIKICVDKGFKNRVNFLLNPDPKYWEDTLYIFNELKDLNIELHPHFLYNDICENSYLYEYPKEFYEYFKDFNKVNGNYVFETKDNYVKINDFLIFKHKLNNFKNWKCYHNNYEISYNGKISNLCKYKQVDIKENPLFFKKITKIEPFICPYNECNCDGLLKTYKEK